MSSSPGTRPSAGSIFAGLVALAVVVALAICSSRTARRSSGASFRRTRSRPAGSSEINDLYTIVFVIAAAIFFLVEGPDRLERHPLPAPARRHGTAAPDPRPQPRRDRVDRHPDDHRHLPVLHLVADAQLRVEANDAATGPQGEGGCGPVPVELRLPAGRRRGGQQAALHGHRPESARMGASFCRPARRPTSTSRAPT